MEPLKLERYLLLGVFIAFFPFPFYLLAFAGLAPVGLLLYGVIFAVLGAKHLMLLILVVHIALSISLMYLLVTLLHKLVIKISSSSARRLIVIVIGVSLIILSQFRVFMVGDVGGGTHYYDLVSIYQFLK